MARAGYADRLAHLRGLGECLEHSAGRAGENYNFIVLDKAVDGQNGDETAAANRCSSSRFCQ
jgi:hypothetical protein